MTYPVTARFALALTLMAATTGCSWFGRKPKAPPTPPPPVVAPEPQPVQPEPQPEAQPAPPQPEVQPPAPQPTPVPQPTQPQPPKPKPQPPAPKPAAPPAFGQILSPQQQQDLLRSYQQSTAAARSVLSKLQGRALNRDQAETANRIRSFLLQAQEAQSKDPSTAAQLAHRAEVLARDLQSTLR